jgi:hypothetical protein
LGRRPPRPWPTGIVDWRDELDPAGDTTCVFRDSAFADDVAKTNLAAILEQHGIETCGACEAHEAPLRTRISTYQLEAIEAVCDLFRGQEICRTEFTVTPTPRPSGFSFPTPRATSASGTGSLCWTTRCSRT